MIKLITEAEIIEGTIVLVRTDWNVPVKDGQVLDTSRIEASLKTINYILEKGGKVIVMSHLGDGSDSLEVVAKEAEKFFPDRRVRFVRDPWNVSSPDGKKALGDLRNGELAVMENLRFWMEKENDECFAKQLAGFADIYVNEAFPCSHRKHTSIVEITKFLPSFAGFKFLEEFQKLSEVFNPEHPFFFVLGGLKFETKLPLIEKFLQIADNIFIGGALAVKAKTMPIADNAKIIFPVGDIEAMDANPETLAVLKTHIDNAKFVLWNGPLGNYEKGFKEGTIALVEMLAQSKAKVVLGGGDTLAVLNPEIKDQILNHGFISTAGGAMLDFLANGTLPGIEALNTK
ncbi:MAG: phosphoglycerate kinase [Candidatus Paceibacterota bacterium]|jgi:3-phosphoglycerate kinase